MALPPSEFGGHTNRLGIHPFPHRPTPAERLGIVYRTGDELEGEGGNYAEPNTEAFQGLLTEEEQFALREAEGAFDKGQVWQEMQEG